MEQFFADLSLVSYIYIVLCVATDKLIYIKDDDTYHTLKNVGVLEFIDNQGDKPSIMNFSASWCGPCKRMAPQFSALSNAYDQVNFVKIDVDASPNLATEERITVCCN